MAVLRDFQKQIRKADLRPIPCAGQGHLKSKREKVKGTKEGPLITLILGVSERA
jgi:hypothetical protein